MNDNNNQYKAKDTEFKHEDTTNVMKIRFIGGNGCQIYPANSHKFIAKVATADGAYMGDYPCSLVGNQFQVNSADLKGLTSGSYKLEVWETYTDDDGKEQTGVFPSPSAFVSFIINKNIEDTAWDLVKEISFQDLVDKAVISSGQHLVVAATNTLASNLPASVTQEFKDGKNQLTFNIPEGKQGPVGLKGDKGDPGAAGATGPQGPKGDTGSVDNAGLTSAPAFQALQTDVNAIKTTGGGVNLAQNTSTDIVADATNSTTRNWVYATIFLDKQPKQGDLITISAEGTLTGTGTLDEYQVALYDYDCTSARSQVNFLKAGQRDSVTLSLDNLDGNGDTVLLIYAGKSGETAGKKNVVHHLMVEEGTIAHAWSPNPTEILTQSDYAKIKGERGPSIWDMKVAVGGNVSGRSITDLYTASATNPPAVNDLVIQPGGNVFNVINVSADGSTFDLGPALFSIKGDTGSVDNAGLTNAPAFQALQTQVNNSAVGTNLFSQSTATAGYINGQDGTVAPIDANDEVVSDYIPVSANSNYTFQMWGTTPSNIMNWYGIGLYDSNKKFISRQSEYGSKQTSDMVEHVSTTITTTSTTAYVRVSFSKYNDYKAKLEKGSVATDWCPNPTEILTQSDYAKIKAAIVALGGSLS